MDKRTSILNTRHTVKRIFRNLELAILLAACVVVSISIHASAQTLTAKYISLEAGENPFNGYQTPIGLAILKFHGNDGIDAELFDALKQEPTVLSRFTIYSYAVLKSQMKALGLTTLEPGDSQVRRQLKEQLGISLIVTGEADTDSGFTLKITSMSGKQLYSADYRNSSKSTAITDAVELFKAGMYTKYLKGSEWGDIKWVYVEGGTFQMGSNDWDNSEPIHSVTVRSFYIESTEVTFSQYDKFCDATGRNKPSDYGLGRGEMPVINVSWDDANAYCQWLSEETGKNIHLPTEAEYEYAARGGNRSNGYTYSGSNNIDEVAWYLGNSGRRPHRVGTKAPNELGIYDMSGNVWEWCEDWYHTSYDGAPTDGSAWLMEDPNNPYRVVRGGSWFNYDSNCRVANRGNNLPSFRDFDNGFRCAQDLR